jgi:hypothetical protein
MGVTGNRPDYEQRHCYHHAPKVKPEAATAVVELQMMGVRTPEAWWDVNKRQDNKLEKLLHLVGDLICIDLYDDTRTYKLEIELNVKLGLISTLLGKGV